MDFSIPDKVQKDFELFKTFLQTHLKPNLLSWYQEGSIPRSFFQEMGTQGWFGFEEQGSRIKKLSSLRGALIFEELAKISPGVAVAMLVQEDLGLLGLILYGSDIVKQKYLTSAIQGKILVSLGNTEGHAGSDVASISTTARKVEGGWILDGTKAYVTNGLLSDFGIITAVTDPEETRNRRISMFFLALNTKGVERKKLNKQVWIPSDLTRLHLKEVFVPDEHLMGEKGRGLQQVLTIFTNSRVPISALTLGTATGAFDLAYKHASKRKIFGRKIINFQAKSFEIADLYAKIEAARLALWKVCWTIEQGGDFRLESSLAKYLAVQVAREVTAWAADMFGASSVIFEHPVHKFPLDAWASSLGEGTQDVQKLVIFREILKRYGQK